MKTSFRFYLIGLALLLAISIALPAGFAQAAIQNYAAWNDLGIVYSPPSGSASFPNVLYSATGFGGASPLYKMWYGDGSGQVFLTTSTNGQDWGAPATVSGLGDDADHLQVLYDAACFGALPCNGTVAKYKMWYWDIDADVFSISALASAKSVDGLAWTNDTALTQVPKAKLVTGTGSSWNKGTKGPISLFYQPRAKNRSKNPFSYKYIMYYAATNGSNEVTALAYSADGLNWTAYSTSAPVLNKGTGTTWDCDDAAFGTIYHDSAGYHYWYSGSGGNNGSGGCAAGNPTQGIGLATSTNGTTWTKTAQPIFHINQGISYRTQGVFAPAVIDEGNGVLRMYYTAASGTAGTPKKIGLAILTSGTVFVDDNWAGLLSGTPVTVSGTPHVIGQDAFDTIQKGINAAATGATVAVAAGTYTEQVTIQRDVTLLGAGSSLSILNAPANLPAASQPTSAIVLIGHGNAELAGLTISGPGPSNCGSIRAGIYVYGNSYANIHNNTIQDIRDSSLGGCSNGIAIQVGSQAEATSATATIDQNTIIGYQKGGILVDNAGSSAGITYNTVTGAGTTGNTVQTGIQISHGATATLSGNTVSGNSFHQADNPADWSGRGLLIDQASMVTLADANVLSNNDRNLEKTGNSGKLILGAETLGPSTAPVGNGYDLYNHDSQSIDATRATFAGAADGFAIEDSVQHQVDDVSLGLVTWEPGNLYVTPRSGKIQRAVNAANPGDTVHVQAGTYIEQITIAKALTLLGPNSAIDPNLGSRVAEAILRPAEIGTDPTGTCTILAMVSSSNVSLKGFTLDGNNPALSSGVTVNGVDVDACKGIAGSARVGTISIEYNLIKNVAYAGVDFSNDTNPAATSNNTIIYNRLENMGDTDGIGVRINHNFYSNITNNVFTAVRTGIQASNFSQANPGPTASIRNNQITSWRNGILFQDHSGGATAFNLQANTLSALNSTLADRWDGITLASVQNSVNVFVEGNILTAPDIHQTTVGYQVWNDPTTASLVIYGGSVNGADYGVWVNNYQGGGGNGGSSSIKIDNVSITGAGLAGIYAQDDPSNTNGAQVQVTSVDSILTGSGVGVLVTGSDASATGLCNQISGNTTGVNNTTVAALDFTNNWWGAATGPSGVGLGSGDSVSAYVNYIPWWDMSTTPCGATPPNNKPVANDQWVVAQQATPVGIILTGFDLEGSPFTYTVVSGPSHGNLTGSAPALTYTPSGIFSGSDSFTFKVNDGTDDSLLPATVHITVIPADRPPAISDPKPANVTISMNGAPNIFSLILHATDPDNDTLSWSILNPAGNGNALVDERGNTVNVYYTPDLNYGGPDSFDVQVSDNRGGTDFITVNVTVNTPPAIAESDPVALRMSKNGMPVGFSLTLHANDVDSDPLTWSIFTPASHGTATASGTGTSVPVAYTPVLDYTGSDSFTVQAVDPYGGVDTIVVDVNINISPIIAETDPALIRISQNGTPVPFNLTLHATDAEADPLTWSIAAPAAHGAAIGSGTGASQAVGYTPTPGFSGADSFVVQVTDNYGGVDTFTVNVIVNSVPVIGGTDPVSIRISQNGVPAAFNLTLLASDPNADPLTWSIATPATHGMATVSGTGVSMPILYTPATDYIGPDSFVVQVSDPYGGTDTVTINVTVDLASWYLYLPLIYR